MIVMFGSMCFRAFAVACVHYFGHTPAIDFPVVRIVRIK